MDQVCSGIGSVLQFVAEIITRCLPTRHMQKNLHKTNSIKYHFLVQRKYKMSNWKWECIGTGVPVKCIINHSSCLVLFSRWKQLSFKKTVWIYYRGVPAHVRTLHIRMRTQLIDGVGPCNMVHDSASFSLSNAIFLAKLQFIFSSTCCTDPTGIALMMLLSYL